MNRASHSYDCWIASLDNGILSSDQIDFIKRTIPKYEGIYFLHCDEVGSWISLFPNPYNILVEMAEINDWGKEFYKLNCSNLKPIHRPYWIDINVTSFKEDLVITLLVEYTPIETEWDDDEGVESIIDIKLPFSEFEKDPNYILSLLDIFILN